MEVPPAPENLETFDFMFSGLTHGLHINGHAIKKSSEFII